MFTLGDKTSKVIRKEESWSICEGVTCKVAVPLGTVVKLDPATGEVEPISAVTDKPFGVVTVGCRHPEEKVTVQTQYNAILRGKASGVVATGDDLSVEANVTVNSETLTKFKKAVAGNYVTAQALSNGANTDDIWVGILRTFHKA